MALLAVFLGGSAGVLLWDGIFFNVLVCGGGGGGAVGPKELMGWVVTVADDRALPSSRTSFHRGWRCSFLQHVEVLL